MGQSKLVGEFGIFGIDSDCVLIVADTFLTSGCAEMPKNMDWFPKWDVGSEETKAEKEKLEPDSTEKPKKKLSYWEKFENWVEAGTKTPDQEESGQESPVKEQSTRKEPVKEKLESDSTEKPKKKLSYWKQIQGWFKGGTKTPEQEEPGHKPSVKKQTAKKEPVEKNIQAAEKKPEEKEQKKDQKNC